MSQSESERIALWVVGITLAVAFVGNQVLDWLLG